MSENLSRLKNFADYTTQRGNLYYFYDILSDDNISINVYYKDGDEEELTDSHTISGKNGQYLYDLLKEIDRNGRKNKIDSLIWKRTRLIESITFKKRDFMSQIREISDENTKINFFGEKYGMAMDIYDFKYHYLIMDISTYEVCMGSKPVAENDHNLNKVMEKIFLNYLMEEDV